MDSISLPGKALDKKITSPHSFCLDKYRARTTAETKICPGLSQMAATGGPASYFGGGPLTLRKKKGSPQRDSLPPVGGLAKAFVMPLIVTDGRRVQKRFSA